MNQSAAEIVCEFGPFPGVESVGGVTYDGEHVWFAAGEKLIALDPANGQTLRSIEVAASAGTAFDGQHLFQIADGRIQKIDPTTGEVLATIPTPEGEGNSGLGSGPRLEDLRGIRKQLIEGYRQTLGTRVSTERTRSRASFVGTPKLPTTRASLRNHFREALSKREFGEHTRPRV
jgi:hypothetical protein